MMVASSSFDTVRSATASARLLRRERQLRRRQLDRRVAAGVPTEPRPGVLAERELELEHDGRLDVLFGLRCGSRRLPPDHLRDDYGVVLRVLAGSDGRDVELEARDDVV